MSDENIVRKIQALLNKAENTTFEAEADAFIAKAQELMMRHAIDEARLAAEGKKVADEIITANVDIRPGVPGTKPRQIFLNQVAKAMSCRMWYTPGTKFNTVCGYSSDVEFVQLMYMSVNLQLSRALLSAVKEAKKEHEARRQEYIDMYGTDGRGKFREAVYRRNFIDGYLNRVAARIYERYLKVDETHGTGTSIVLRDRSKVVEAHVASIVQLGKARSSKAASYDPYARAAGRAAGDNADISGGRGHVGRGTKGELN